MLYQAEYDEDNWPIVVVSLPTIPLSDEEFRAHLSRLTAYYSRGCSFGRVIGQLTASPSSRQASRARC
jgi:hypothetical protein